MLPLNPSTPYTRPPKFVAEEWTTYFGPSSPYPASTTAIQGGWKGILYANLALIDAKASWEFFAQAEGFDGSWIDGGGSRTWYLAFAAGEFLGGGLFFIVFFQSSRSLVLAFGCEVADN